MNIVGTITRATWHGQMLWSLLTLLWYRYVLRAVNKVMPIDYDKVAGVVILHAVRLHLAGWPSWITGVREKP